MKNKFIFLGSLCLIMAFGLVISGCPNEVQVVDYAAIGAPKDVVGEYKPKTTGANAKPAHVYITFTAVKDASGYNIVLSQDGAKTWVSAGYSYTVRPIRTEVDATSTKESHNTVADVDKYEAEIPVSTIPYRGSFKFGVITESNRGGQRRSSPAWTKVIDVPVQEY